jgi:hypothetical protein
MSDLTVQYTDEMHDQFHLYAAWTPDYPFALGDVGILNPTFWGHGNIFSRKTSLKELGFKDFSIRKGTAVMNPEFSSKGGVTTTFKLSGSVAPVGSVLSIDDAGFIIEFADENLTTFEALGAKTESIENQVEIGQEILKRYREENPDTHPRYWNKEWVVIVDLLRADSSTVFISDNKNAKVEVRANANIKNKDIKIADPKFEFSIAVTSNLHTEILCDKGLAPLFKLSGIKTNIFGGNPSVENKFRSGFDLLTPENAKKEFKDNVFFGYISDDPRE